MAFTANLHTGRAGVMDALFLLVTEETQRVITVCGGVGKNAYVN
jgi:hypothetical protein